MVGDTVLGPRHEMELLHLVSGRVTPLQGKGERARSLKHLIFSGIHDFASSASRQMDYTAVTCLGSPRALSSWLQKG